jgi:hypothetical protein
LFLYITLSKNKNLTKRCFPEQRIREKKWGYQCRKKGACQGDKQAVSESGEKREDRHT